ncbi:hypothetical protein ACFL6U_18900 [Planctomycetota bacterium]
MRSTHKLSVFMFFSAVMLSSLISGCSINKATAKLTPGENLDKINKIYVVHLTPDKRYVNKLIATKLESMGYEAPTGPKSEIPANVDAIATYRDKWYWDMTNFMMELTITLRDPVDQYPIAEGYSMHTSFTRKSPKEMVDEVVTNIFKQKDNAQ